MITLGVIGVVAAITIPTLFSNYQKTMNVQRLKQTYSMIQQAMRLVSEDFGGGGMNDWACPNAQYYQSAGQSRCVYLIFEKIANAKIFPKVEDRKKVMCYIEGKDYPEYTYVNGSKIANNAHVFCTHGASASLPNGACVAWNALYWCAEGGGSFVIDVNGSYNGPNRMGRDVFLFGYGRGNDQRNPLPGSGLALFPRGYRLNDNGVVVPASRKSLIRDWQGCNKTQEGNYCTGLLVNDGWKISPDYAW